MSLYMSYAICAPEDNFDFKTGIKIAKNRYTYPLETNNFLMLNDDQVNVLVENEVNYIDSNLEKFIKPTKKCFK